VDLEVQLVTVSSTTLKHDSACSLFDDGHRIASKFYDVLDDIESDIAVAASGCGTCFHTDAPMAVFYIAQGSGTDELALKYDADNDARLTREELGEYICATADAHGVEYSWNGSTDMCVILGVSDAYRNFEPGARVTTGRRDGVVVDPDIVNRDTDYLVHEDTESVDGELVAEFTSRDDAERFVRNSARSLSVSRARNYATRDGDNVVLWDGSDSINIVSGKRLSRI